MTTVTRLKIPRIQTARLLLRAPEERDFDAYAAFYASPRAAGAGGQLDLRDAFRSFAALLGHWHLKGYGWWMLDLDGQAIGFTGIHHPPHKAERELGWVLYDGYEGQGFAREAARAARDYGRTTLGLDRLVSYILNGNTPSERLACALGATRETAPPAHNADVGTWVHDLRRAA